MYYFFILIITNSVQIDFIPFSKTPPAASSSFPLLFQISSNTLIHLSSSSSTMNIISSFSLSSLTWSRQQLSSTIAPPLIQNSACALYKNFIYIIGGLTLSGPTSEVWVLSLNSFQVIYKKWERLACKGSFPQIYASGYVADDLKDPENLFVYGGFTGSQVNSQVFQ